MAKDFYYGIGRVNREYLDYGGVIYNYDYDAHHTMADIANRIAADLKFEKKCKQSAKFRDNNEKYRTELMRGRER